MSVFEDIKTGPEQAIAYEKGACKAKTTVMHIAPVEVFTPGEIRDIRVGTGMTQVLFARYMGVSPKTVESWESGRNHPEGAACRLLALTRNDPSFPVRSGIVAD